MAFNLNYSFGHVVLIYLIKTIQRIGFLLAISENKTEADARNGMHMCCLQVKYSLFMQCVNVLFPSRRWGNEEPGERRGNIRLFHKYRLRQLVPALCFPPKSVNGALEQRKVSQVEIMMAMMEGFLWC